MTSPFSGTATAPPRSWLDRLLRRVDVGAAAAAIEREFAQTWPSPTRGSVLSLLREHRIGKHTARRVSIGLFAKALHAFAANREVSAEEADQLRRLQSILGLVQRDVGEAHRQVAESIYSASLAEALDGEDLTTEERSRLDALTAGLRISVDRRGLLHREQAEAILQRKLGRKTPNRMLTPREEEGIRSMAKKYGIRMTYDVAIQAHFDRFSLRWQIEHGELPSFVAPIDLEPGEICHYQSPARWHEKRANAPEVESKDDMVSAVTPIMKGLSYRSRGAEANPAPLHELTEIDAGRLFITNKRLVLDGAEQKLTIPHSDVVALDPYLDGFGVEKVSGTALVLIIENDVEIATAIAAEALARS